MSYYSNKKKQKRNILYFLAASILILVLFTPITRLFFDMFEKPISIAFLNINTVKNHLTQGYQTKQDLFDRIKKLEEQNSKLSLENLKIDYLETFLEEDFLNNENQNKVSSFILSKDHYGSIIIDKGLNDGVTVETAIFSLNDSLLGFVSEVFDHTSKVSLLYAHDNKVQGILFPENISVDLEGNGNALVTTLNREVNVSENDIIFSQGYTGNIIGLVSYIDFDPRDPSKKVFISPVENIKEIQNVYFKK